MRVYQTRNGIELTYELLTELEYCGLSEAEIGKFCSISRGQLYKIRKVMKWPQVVRSDKGEIRVDPEESRIKRNKYMKDYRRKNPGKFAYRHIRAGRTIMGLHRLKAEKVLGRPLKRWEVVHHIDGNPDNNENNNLVICTQDYHICVLHGYKALELREKRMLEAKQ